MVQKNCGAIPIVENLETFKPVGIITDRDITLRTLANGRNPLDMTAGDVMTIHPVTLTSDVSIETCCRVMENRSVRRIIVIDDAGKCIGIVAQADIARSAPEHETAKLVKDISIASFATAG
jgi:CBS domain-containing protein